jgi:hypothetical protein
MRILFVENREKTLFWEQVALSLQKKGCEVAWLVQNPAFRPKQFAESSGTFILPYPHADARELPGDLEAWVRERHPSLVMDRGRNFFKTGAAHYDHYKAEIRRVLAAQCPDLVVGESTLFHELITIDLCRAAGIDYVQPMSNRYPRGRFSLLAFDTQIPAIESGDGWPEPEAEDLAERIATASEIPFYMKAPGRAERLLLSSVWAVTRGRVWWARLHGERYNTPSLSRKLTLKRQVKRNLRRWRSLQRLPVDPKSSLLYPMQLQPEMNIDVWGRPYSDQVEIIRGMLAAAPPEFQIAVKANPKAKYELSEVLFALATSNPRVCLLPLDMTMPEAFSHSIGAVTATGTVGFEAICGKGRAISLRHPLVEQEFPNFHAASPAEAVHRLINEPLAGVGSISAGAKLINRFVSQSFPGLVGDPASYPQCMEPNNINAIAGAIFQLVNTGAAPQ